MKLTNTWNINFEKWLPVQLLKHVLKFRRNSVVVKAFQVQLMEFVDICTKHDKALSASSELHWDLQKKHDSAWEGRGCALLGSMIKNKKTPPPASVPMLSQIVKHYHLKHPSHSKNTDYQNTKLEASHPQSAKICKKMYIKITRLCCIHLYQSWYVMCTNMTIKNINRIKFFLPSVQTPH